MTSVNTGRVILGGLVAGAVINIGDYLINNLLLAEAWQRLAQGHNIDQTVMGGTAAFATFVTIDFLLGVLLVWFYAAIRPRYGPGPSTAVIAAFGVFSAYILMLATFGGWFISWDLFIKMAGLLLVTFVAAGLVGALLYSEAPPPVRAPERL